VKIVDLLIQHGANPRLVDSQDVSCLHFVTHSSNYWAVLFILCQPDMAVDVRDYMGLTPLHWATQQGDEVSTQILLKFGADPNAVDHDGLTALHWAASTGNKSCIAQLLEAGADIGAKNNDQHTAQEMADRYRNRAAWDMVVKELGIKADGTRVRRPLSEVCGFPWASFLVAVGSCLKVVDVSVAQCEHHHLHTSHHFPLYRFLCFKRISLVYEFSPLSARVYRHGKCT
jgi:hypothetical protein